jgi:hypothetical protein
MTVWEKQIPDCKSSEKKVKRLDEQWKRQWVPPAAA